MLRRHLLILPALLLGTALGVPAAAQAQNPGLAIYEIETRGTGEQSYNRSGEACFGQQWTEDMAATWNWTTKQSAEMIGGELQLTGPAKTTVQLGSATKSKHLPTCSTAGTISASCVGTGLRNPTAAIGTRLEPGAMTDTGQPLTVAGWGQTFAIMDNCSGGVNAPSGDMILLAPKPAETTILPTEQHLTFSRSLSGVVTGEDCPWYDPTVDSCSYGWEATVTFKKLQMPTGPGNPNPRPPAGQPQGPPSWPGTPGVPHNPPPPSAPSGPRGGGGPTAPPTGPAPGGPKGGGITIGGGKLGPRNRTAKVKVKCSSGCKVSAAAIARQRQSTGKGKGKGGKKRVRARGSAAAVLGRAAATLDAGKERELELRFSAASARAISRAGGIVLTVKVTPVEGGSPVTRALTIRAAG